MDSGFNAALAAGVLHLFASDEGKKLIAGNAYTYQRLDMLCKCLEAYGMRLAVKPQAGFFTLWNIPKRAFGQEILDARQFNFLMIEKTGVVGVHFHPYIRYAVCGDVEAMLAHIGRAFGEAKVGY